MTSTVEPGERRGINFARLLMSFGPLIFTAADQGSAFTVIDCCGRAARTARSNSNAFSKLLP